MKPFVPGCPKCKNQLVEDFEGFPLGFLWCNTCNTACDHSIKLPNKNFNRINNMPARNAQNNLSKGVGRKNIRSVNRTPLKPTMSYLKPKTSTDFNLLLNTKEKLPVNCCKLLNGKVLDYDICSDSYPLPDSYKQPENYIYIGEGTFYSNNGFITTNQDLTTQHFYIRKHKKG